MSTLIDPVTRQYKVLPSGGLQQTDSHRNAVLIAMCVELGSIPGEPNIGSELHLLRRAKNTEAVPARAGDMARAALVPLAKLGVIESYEVHVERDESGLRLQVDYYAGRKPYSFSRFIRVG